MKEELASARRRIERAKKIETASSADEVLMEEVREYKVCERIVSDAFSFV
jgi:E3 ubiquitin-protein ligase BRE1